MYVKGDMQRFSVQKDNYCGASLGHSDVFSVSSCNGSRSPDLVRLLKCIANATKTGNWGMRPCIRVASEA